MVHRRAGFRGVPPYIEWPPRPRKRKKLEIAVCPHCEREFELPHFRPGIRHSGEACDKIREVTRGAPQESMWALFLDSRNRAVGAKEICRGTVGTCVTHPRDVFREAVAHNAAAVIVAHNHPSGHVGPSEDDETLTVRLIEAGKVMGVPVLDHLVVGETGCYSIREGGRVKF
jgi:DNA repair protein RadC